MEKIRIDEVIIVEGRDDTCAINRAVSCLTIETHGFGIKKETWDAIEKAYNEKGIIIFTDPDYSGEEIRKRLIKRFPDAKQAFLTKGQASKKGDIGIENAKPEDIITSLSKAKCTIVEKDIINYTEGDLYEAGLIGRQDSKERRQALGRILAIGYSNGKGLLKKLNNFNIDKEEFYEAIRTIDNKGN